MTKKKERLSVTPIQSKILLRSTYFNCNLNSLSNFTKQSIYNSKLLKKLPNFYLKKPAVLIVSVASWLVSQQETNELSRQRWVPVVLCECASVTAHHRWDHSVRWTDKLVFIVSSGWLSFLDLSDSRHVQNSSSQWVVSCGGCWCWVYVFTYRLSDVFTEEAIMAIVKMIEFVKYVKRSTIISSSHIHE